MNKKISNITLFSSIIITIVFCAVIIISTWTILNKFAEKNSSAIRSFYITQQKELIKNEVNRLIKRIHATKTNALNLTKTNLSDQVNSAEEFISTIYMTHPEENQKSHIDSMISSFSWDHNAGYFYIISKDGVVLHHGARPEMVGKNIFKQKDNYPKLYDFIQHTIYKGHAFGEYNFYKPGGNTGLAQKLGYAKYNKSLGLIIGSGIYLDDFNQEVKDEILETVKDERFGFQNYGYFWIFDAEYNTVFHIDPGMYSTDLYNLKDTKGNYILRDFLKIATSEGRGFTSYYWNIPGRLEESEKISYLEYLPEWNWIVGSGFYFENFKELIKTEEAISKNVLNDQLRINSLVIFILFSIVSIISTMIYKRISSIEREQEDYLNDLLQYKTIIDKSAIVSITDLRGIILHVNDQMCYVTGFDKNELLGSRHTKLGHPDNPVETYQELWSTITAGKIWRGILKNLTKDGGYFYQKSTIIPFKNKHGEIVRYIAISHDVTEVFENKSQLQKYLNSDQLTELNNRSSLMLEIKNAKSGDLAIIDIDSFHNINETYGMKVGDELLRIFAKKLKEKSILNNYTLYRLHSDVFAIFSQQSDKNLFIMNVEKALSQITKETFKINGTDIIITTITGYAHGSDNIMSHADAALQFAKANNISHYVYDPLEVDNSKIYEQNSRVVKMLNEAIEEDRVIPFFQPIIGGEEKKYETLMRIVNDDGSIVSPAEFIDISKQTRFYPTLTKLIVTKAIDKFADSATEFSINISSEDITNPNTMSYIYEYAQERGVIDRLILEIVESESLSSYSATEAILHKFKQEGAKIAIDDFGTGYSNFDYLLKLKADFIKIDGSIIKLINKDERAVDVVTSIVSYAKKLKMKTIAEFISDESLSIKAKELGIDYQQGYYHGKPEPNPKDE